MFSHKTLQVLRILACMVVIGYYGGYLYERLYVGNASIRAWIVGIISLIGWFHIFWRVAFCASRPQRNKKK